MDEHTKQVQDQAILDALGGSLPTIQPAKPKRVWPLALVITIVLMLVVCVLIAIFLPNDEKDVQSAIPTEISAIDAKPAIDAASSFVQQIQTEEFGVAREVYSHPLSPYGSQDLSSELLEKYLGSVYDWSSCVVQQADSYSATQFEEVDGLVYDVAYIPYVCVTVTATQSTLEFDVRQSADYGWRVYNIVVRN